MRQITKNILLTSCAFLSGLPAAWAFDVSVESGRVLLQPADQERLAVFSRFEDVWIVSNSDVLPRVVGNKVARSAAGIKDMETLAVDGGSGVRLRYVRQANFDIIQSDSGVMVVMGKPQALPASQLQTPKDTPIVSMNNTVRFGGTQKPLLAHSFVTGETYGALPVRLDQKVANVEGQALGVLTVLPSLHGLAFISANGSALQVGRDGGFYTLEPLKEGVAPVVVDKTPEDFDPVAFLNRPLESLPAIETPVAEEISGTAFQRAIGRLDAALAAIDRLDVSSYQPPEYHQQLAVRTLPDAPKEGLSGDFGALKEEAKVRQAMAQEVVADLVQAADASETQHETVVVDLNPKKEEKWKLTPNNVWDDADLFAGDVVPQVDGVAPRVDGWDTMPFVDTDEAFDPFAPVEEGAADDMETLFADAPDAPPGETIFPRFDEVQSETPYLTYERYFMRKLYEAETPEGRDWVRLKLAELSIAYQRYRQAEGILLQLPTNEETGLPEDPRARILMGASLVMQDRAKEALPFLEVAAEPEADRMLWLAYAYEKDREYNKAQALFQRYLGQSVEYPTHLQRALRLSQAQALLALKKFTALDESFESMLPLYPEGLLTPDAKYIKAQARIAEGNTQLGEVLLAEVANSGDPEVAYDAQYDFVNYLLNRKEVSRQTAIQHMEDLRYLWRGGDLEKKVLKRLGRLYLIDGDKRSGFERLKYRNIYFPDAEDVEEVASIMVDEFTQIFFDDKVGDLDPLFVLGLYYDFRELTPPGKRGDELVFRVAQRLRGLGLFDRAVNLLERQLKYRVKTEEESARFGGYLAQLYLLNQAYEKGLDALIRTEPQQPVDAAIKADRAMIRAKLNVALENYDEAERLLADIQTEEALEMRVDLSWGRNDYNNIITMLESRFADEEKRQEAWGPQDQLYLLRLAFAYNITGQRSKLVALQQAYAKEALNPVVAQPLSFLNTDMDVHYPIDQFDKDRPWYKLTDTLKSYNDLVDTYNQHRQSREEERYSRIRYNRRMGQPVAPRVKNTEK